MIRVVITCGDKDLFKRLPESTTVSQLKTLWGENYEIDAEDLLLSSEGHKNLHDDARICDIAEDPTKVLQLTIQQALKLEFSVMGIDKAHSSTFY